MYHALIKSVWQLIAHSSSYKENQTEDRYSLELFTIYRIIKSDIIDNIKTHGSVSCGPRKRGVRKRSEYIDRNNKVAIFTHP